MKSFLLNSVDKVATFFVVIFALESTLEPVAALEASLYSSIYLYFFSTNLFNTFSGFILIDL